MGYSFSDITLYYFSNNDSWEKEFTIRQNLVSNIYVDFFNGYKPKGTTRISITLENEDRIFGFFGSILSLNTAFDKDKYWTKKPNEQNQIILDTIHRAVLLCADKYDWDKTVFELAYHKTIESGFIYKKELKRKLSKDKQHYASILIEKDGVVAIISVMFYDKANRFLKSTKLLTSFHYDVFHPEKIENNKWFNNREYGLYTKSKEVIIKASLDTSQAQIVITPDKTPIEELEGYVRKITYRKITSQSDWVVYVNQ
jgi:hypothetical protein